MKFVESPLKGVFEIEFSLVQDERGSFRRDFCEVEFKNKGIDATVRQGNLSRNAKRGTLRGFHFQSHPHWEPKTVSCLSGSVHALVVDLRPDSQTYKKWVSYVLDFRKPIDVHVPIGCAMAWLTLEDNTVLHYYMGELYKPKSAAGIRYNDPVFAFQWPFAPIVISDKDRAIPDFDPSVLGEACS